MRTLLKYAVALSCLVGLASIDAAAAKPRHPHHGAVYAHHDALYAHSRPPLLVERRSFLDPGTQVPVGSTNRYVWQPAYDWGNDPSNDLPARQVYGRNPAPGVRPAAAKSARPAAARRRILIGAAASAFA